MVSNCGKTIYSRRLCAKHYRQNRYRKLKKGKIKSQTPTSDTNEVKELRAMKRDKQLDLLLYMLDLDETCWLNKEEDDYFTWWQETPINWDEVDEELIEDYPQYATILKKLIANHQQTINKNV